jgi:hypothetical protein
MYNGPGKLPSNLPGKILVLLGLSLAIRPIPKKFISSDRNDLIAYEMQLEDLLNLLKDRNDIFAKRVRKWAIKEKSTIQLLLTVGTVLTGFFPKEK